MRRKGEELDELSLERTADARQVALGALVLALMSVNDATEDDEAHAARDRACELLDEAFEAQADLRRVPDDGEDLPDDVELRTHDVRMATYALRSILSMGRWARWGQCEGVSEHDSQTGAQHQAKSEE